MEFKSRMKVGILSSKNLQQPITKLEKFTTEYMHTYNTWIYIYKIYVYTCTACIKDIFRAKSTKANFQSRLIILKHRYNRRWRTSARDEYKIGVKIFFSGQLMKPPSLTFYFIFFFSLYDEFSFFLLCVHERFNVVILWFT